MYGVKICEDVQHADINFLVDASSSVGTSNWEFVKAFMNSIVDKLVIGDDSVSFLYIVQQNPALTSIAGNIFDQH